MQTFNQFTSIYTCTLTLHFESSATFISVKFSSAMELFYKLSVCCLSNNPLRYLCYYCLISITFFTPSVLRMKCIFVQHLFTNGFRLPIPLIMCGNHWLCIPIAFPFFTFCVVGMLFARASPFLFQKGSLIQKYKLFKMEYKLNRTSFQSKKVWRMGEMEVQRGGVLKPGKKNVASSKKRVQ